MPVPIFRFALPPSVQPDAVVTAPPRLAVYLEKKLGQPVDVTVSHSYDAMLRNLKSGALDAAWAPPMLCARAEPDGMRVIVQAVRGGNASYASAFVMRAGSGQPLNQWRGLRAAFVEPLSVAGHLLPMAYLREHGFHPQALFSEQNFVGSYREGLLAVRDGNADVCCVHALEGEPDSPRRAMQIHLPDQDPAAFTIIATTRAVPSDGVVVRASEGKATRRLERAFLAQTGNPFAELFRAESFVKTAPGAYRALYRVAPR